MRGRGRSGRAGVCGRDARRCGLVGSSSFFGDVLMGETWGHYRARFACGELGTHAVCGGRYEGGARTHGNCIGGHVGGMRVVLDWRY